MIEKILVKLEADIKDYVRDLEKANKQNKETGKSGSNMALALGRVGAAASAVAAPLAAVAVGVGAVGAALASMSLQAASNRRELERFARQAKTTTDEFASLAFATKQYGLDADSVADITKDLSDRFGEFATAGTGTFQDFADVMGLSAEEARKAAVEFGNMSGRDAIQAMVSRMESAGASGEQMTFVLESMGSELSRLQPLFANNGAELERLTSKYDKLNEQLGLSEQQAEELKGLSESFDLLQGTVGRASDAIGARFAPYLNDLINSVITIVPQATNTIIDFFNSFIAADELNSLRDIDAQIKDTTESILEAEERIAEGRSRGDTATRANLRADRERLEQLQAQRLVIEEQNEQYMLQEAIRREGGEISSGSGGTTTNLDEEKLEKEREAEATRLEMLAEFALTREEQLLEQYAKEMEMLAEYQAAVGASDEELYARRLEAGKKFRDDMARLKGKEAKDEDEKQKDIQLSMEQGLNVAKLVGAAMFEDNKAVKAGLIVADTASAIMRSLSISPYDYGNVAVLAVTGAIQLANALSSSKGGGSTSGSAGGGSTITNRPEDFERETTSLELSSATDSGASTGTIKFATDSGDELLDTIANLLNKGQKEGRFA